jgi:Ca2+:H+ antiporter
MSVTVIEVSLISSIMLHGANEPTLARDTMFAVLMVILNAMSTKLPAFTRAQAIFFAAVTVVLYGVFLLIQTVRHTDQFRQPGSHAGTASAAPDPLTPDETAHEHGHHEVGSLPCHAVLLFLTMLPILLLAENLAVFVDYGTETIGTPAALGGLIVATLVLTPEGLGAFRAAFGNRLQRSVNILLGSALATISLTVPAVLMIGLIIHRQVQLGLDPVEMVLLILTLAVSALTFTGGRTNVLQGAIHLVLFAAFIVLIFSP